MGLFWDLFQSSQISEQRDRSVAIDDRVQWLEEELQRTQTLLRDVIGRLEERLGGDIDSDGKIG